MLTLSRVQRTLVERCLGVTVSFKWGGRRLVGLITYVSYTVFNVRVETLEGERFVDPRKCRVIRRRCERIPVLHHVRLDVWHYGSGYYGAVISHLQPWEVVEHDWLEPQVERVLS